MRLLTQTLLSYASTFLRKPKISYLVFYNSWWFTITSAAAIEIYDFTVASLYFCIPCSNPVGVAMTAASPCEDVAKPTASLSDLGQRNWEQCCIPVENELAATMLSKRRKAVDGKLVSMQKECTISNEQSTACKLFQSFIRITTVSYRNKVGAWIKIDIYVSQFGITV